MANLGDLNGVTVWLMLARQGRQARPKGCME
jgi:hypothetical protein